MNEMNVILVDEIMGAVRQTDEYHKLINNDPLIKQAERSLEAIYTKFTPVISQEDMGELEDAVLNLVNAHTDISILYGIHVRQGLLSGYNGRAEGIKDTMQRQEGSCSSCPCIRLRQS